MMLGTQSPSSPTPGILAEAFDQAKHPRRKRKAESQDNDRERLSKRLSLLNIEQNGSKLYVPVETPSVNNTTSTCKTQDSAQSRDETMQLDDSKHKVYIYNIDDELSSDSECEDGKLIFLPDIEKYLKENRIPRHILANSEGELAGMQLVLYSDPKSLSVPEEQDGVRKAIIEARQRARDKQRQESEASEAINNILGHPAVGGHQAAVDDMYEAMEVD